MNSDGPIVCWLLQGDPAVRWQVLRDLAAAPPHTVEQERRRVAEEGWGKRLLSYQESDGRWGGGLYSPKWTSTTYTLLTLRQLGLPPEHPQALCACRLLLDKGLCDDGGIDFSPTNERSETCITGMVLSLLAYFRLEDESLHLIRDCLLNQQLPDGGWNCRAPRGAQHSSFHTTILVLEGLREYQQAYPQKRETEKVQEAQARGREFLLVHRLFCSHRTGEVVNENMTRFSFPPRWHYDILRALEYFRDCGAEWDPRLAEAIDIVQARRKADGRWRLQNHHPGKEFFRLEELGKPSRINTLRALRVLKW